MQGQAIGGDEGGKLGGDGGAGGGGGREIKVSLDGYDSETDEWVDEEAIAGGALREYDAGGDAKAAAKRDLAERDAARRHAEQRKLDGRQEHAAVAGGAAASPEA